MIDKNFKKFTNLIPTFTDDFLEPKKATDCNTSRYNCEPCPQGN